MKNKSLRRSLLTSVVSLATCSTMFVGTTFAWFTDSVTSARNVIQSGNLDITLNYWDGDSFEEVGKNTKLFNDAARWEPGHTEVAYLEIANAGSLALKYQLAVNVFNETLGKTKDGAEIKLSDYLVFTVKEIEKDKVGSYDRAEAKEFAGTAMGLKEYKSEYIPLEKTNDADYVAMVIYMPESVQNEANHNGVDVPSIEMGVSLFATQYAYEEDSFNNEYDKNAPDLYTVNGTSYKSVTEALAAAKDGDNVVLSGITAPINVDKAIDLTISRATVQAGEGVNAMTISADATVKFDGANSFVGGKGADGISIVGANAVLTGETANLTVKGNNCVDGSKDVKIGGSGIGADENSSIVIKDLANLVAEGYGTAGFGIGGATKSVTIENSTVEYAAGGFVQPKLVYDTSYGKSEPEGGAAIGSMTSGAQINIKNSTIVRADGGSKAAAIGARYHTGVTVNITDSNVTAFGGNASAGIGGSRVSDDLTAEQQCNTIDIKNSTVNATGGDFGAGIGTGYDTHCGKFATPLVIINIDATSNITAQGGKYGAGIGTGYHVAAVIGNIECEVNAKDGGSREKYTVARPIGFGVVDMTKEGSVGNFYINYMGMTITLADKVITTAEQFLALGGKSLEGNVFIGADIDLNGAAMPAIGAAYGKTLIVNGDGYTISNGTTAHTAHNGMKHHGMFYAYTNSTLTINNLTFDNITIDATNDATRNFGAGIVVCYADGGSNVTLNNVDVHNCKVLNNTPDIGDEAGVFVGYQTGTLTMINCDSTGCTVAGETAEKTGAMIGMVNGTATLTNCTTDLTIGICNRVAGTLTIN